MAVFEVAIGWADHQLKKAVIRSYSGNTPDITVMGKRSDLKKDPRFFLSSINDPAAQKINA